MSTPSDNAAGSAGTDSDKPSQSELMEFWAALKADNLEKIKSMATAKPGILDADFGHANNTVKAASYLSKPATMQVLLDLGCNADARTSTEDDSHWTALHKAVCDGNEEMVKVLLTSGADSSLTWNGKSSVDLAKEKGNEGVQRLLESKSTPTSSAPQAASAPAAESSDTKSPSEQDDPKPVIEQVSADTATDTTVSEAVQSAASPVETADTNDTAKDASKPEPVADDTAEVPTQSTQMETETEKTTDQLPGQASEATEPANPAQLTEPSNPTEPINTTEPTNASEPAESAQPTVQHVEAQDASCAALDDSVTKPAVLDTAAASTEPISMETETAVTGDAPVNTKGDTITEERDSTATPQTEIKEPNDETSKGPSSSTPVTSSPSIAATDMPGGGTDVAEDPSNDGPTPKKVKLDEALQETTEDSAHKAPEATA